MIRLGVIGYGFRIKCVIQAIREIEPEFKAVAVVDPDPEGVRARLNEEEQDDIVFYPTVKEMVKSAKLDALAIGTRCNLHTQYAIEVAEYGLPLFLEKPVAVSMEQATALEEAYVNAKGPVLVSFPLRVSPLAELTRRAVEKGAVGEPEHIMASNYVPYGTVYWECDYRDFDITGGLFLQKATHDFDCMSYLMGSNVVRVAAMRSVGRIFGGNRPAGLRCSDCADTRTCLESPYNRKRNNSGGTTQDHFCLFSVDSGTEPERMNEDSSSALLEFASGAHGVYTQVFYSRRSAGTRGATISGYQGTLQFDWYTNKLRHVRHHEPFADTSDAGGGMAHFGGDRELAYNFVDVIRGDAESKADIWAGIQSCYSCLAARESANTGQFVSVRQVGQVTA